MPANSLVQGESLGKIKTRSQESKPFAHAVLSETRAAVAALAVAIGSVAPAFGAGPADQGREAATKVAMASRAAVPENSPAQTDFLAGLDAHLTALAERGIVARDTVSGINGDFRKFAEGNPKIYQRPGFEYAIPTIRPFAEPTGPLMLKSFERSKARKITEIIGAESATEDSITEIFRRMYAPKKEDGIFYEIFVKEPMRLSVEDGLYRTKTGEVDKQAVYEAIERTEDTFARWRERFGEMRQDGRLARFVTAVNGAIAYAEKNGIALKPVQVRRGFVFVASCIAAKPEDEPSLYADSCAHTMTWMGERPHPGAIELQFYNSQTGENGYKRIMAPWDAKYAKEVYGSAFTDTQAKANDNFWRDYFKLYVGTAKANRSALAAAESGELLKVEKAIGRVAKLLRYYAEGTPFEGKKVALPDIRAAIDEAKRLKVALESTASPSLKAYYGYKETMDGLAQVVAAAKMVGVE